MRLFADVVDIRFNSSKTTRKCSQQCEASNSRSRRQKTYVFEREQVLSTRRPESSATSTPSSCSPIALRLLFVALASSPVLLLELEFDEALRGGKASWTLAECNLVAVVLRE
jgi:hypothetical protein